MTKHIQLNNHVLANSNSNQLLLLLDLQSKASYIFNISKNYYKIQGGILSFYRMTYSINKICETITQNFMGYILDNDYIYDTYKPYHTYYILKDELSSNSIKMSANTLINTIIIILDDSIIVSKTNRTRRLTVESLKKFFYLNKFPNCNTIKLFGDKNSLSILNELYTSIQTKYKIEYILNYSDFFNIDRIENVNYSIYLQEYKDIDLNKIYSNKVYRIYCNFTIIEKLDSSLLKKIKYKIILIFNNNKDQYYHNAISKESIINEAYNHSIIEYSKQLIVNKLYFGNLYILNDGSISTSYNTKDIISSIFENKICYEKILDSTTIGMTTRKKFIPCNDCIFNHICIPVTYFEFNANKSFCDFK